MPAGAWRHAVGAPLARTLGRTSETAGPPKVACSAQQQSCLTCFLFSWLFFGGEAMVCINPASAQRNGKTTRSEKLVCFIVAKRALSSVAAGVSPSLRVRIQRRRICRNLTPSFSPLPKCSGAVKTVQMPQQLIPRRVLPTVRPNPSFKRTPNSAAHRAASAGPAAHFALAARRATLPGSA